MRTILPVRDASQVRLGAGMRRQAATPVPVTGARSPAATVAPRRPASTVPARVADAGRVRLGAGMRRG